MTWPGFPLAVVGIVGYVPVVDVVGAHGVVEPGHSAGGNGVGRSWVGRGVQGLNLRQTQTWVARQAVKGNGVQTLVLLLGSVGQNLSQIPEVLHLSENGNKEVVFLSKTT